MIQLVLFDLDGTLIQSTDIIIDTFKEIFATYFPEVKLSEKEYSNFLGQTLFDTLGFYAKDHQDIDDLVHAYRALSQTKIEKELKAYSGALQVITYLKKKGCKIGVVTSKIRRLATEHLTKVQLFEQIDGLIGYEDVINHKPNPEPILKALELFGVEGEAAIYIGDHENDIVAAKKAGILSCAVTYSYRLKEMLDHQPDFVIDELKHLKDIV